MPKTAPLTRLTGHSREEHRERIARDGECVICEA